MSRVNKTRYAILGLLSYLPMSGYDIKKTIEKSIGFFWSESNGQLYPILNQLVQEKSVTCQIDEASGKRQRKVYTITPTGTQELQAWLTMPIELTPRRDELLLKLYFGQHVNIMAMIEHVTEERHRLEKKLKEIQELELKTKQEHADKPDLAFWLITNYSSHCQVEARIKWCDETLRMLNELRINNDNKQ